MAVALDKLSRPVRDLRISVTDRCNFRCVYCMPKEIFGKQFEFLHRDQLLTFEEIERLTRVFAGMGVEKLRITGGEPLVRRNVDELIARLALVPGIRDVTLTTNGSLLARMAERLATAGLNRVTVSLDSLDDDTFRAMNDVDFPVADVLAGIEAALAAGLAPVKVNMVVKRGANEHSILAMAERFRGTGVILRFIEYMDVGATNHWQLDEVVPSAEIARLIGERWPIEPSRPGYRGEVATRYRYLDGAGEIGFISSVTQPFCHDCTRARLSAEGKLYTCLFASSRPRPARDGPRRAVRRASSTTAARPLARARRPLLRAAHAGHGSRPAQGRDVAHRRLARRAPHGACEQELHAHALAARSLADALRESLGTLGERRGRGGVSTFPRPGGSGGGARRGDSPGPCRDGTPERSISEIVLRDAIDRLSLCRVSRVSRASSPLRAAATSRPPRASCTSRSPD